MLGTLAQSLEIIFVERQYVSFFNFFIEFFIQPFKDGEFLLNSSVFWKLINLLCTSFVESNWRIFGQLQILLKFMSLSNVQFSYFELSLEFSAHQFPLFIQFNAGRTVSLIDVDEEGISWFQKGWLPVGRIQEDGIALLPEFLLTIPFFFCSLLFLLLMLLICFQFFCLFCTILNHRIEIFQHKGNNFPCIKISTINNRVLSIISIKWQRFFSTINWDNFKETRESIIDFLKNILVFSWTYISSTLPALWTSQMCFPEKSSCSNSSSLNEMTDRVLMATKRIPTKTKIFINIYTCEINYQ